MTTLQIATDLRNDETNVIVNSVDELNKFAKFFGSNSFYIWTVFGWMTLNEWLSSNKIEDLF